MKFEYFHKVDELIPNQSNDQIERMLITEQVKLKSADYDPFVDVNGLPCCPSKPNYSQIDNTQAALLQNNNINLESHWSNWPDVYQSHFGQTLLQKTLALSADFAQVIFGISVAGLEHICPQLSANDTRLKTAVKKLKQLPLRYGRILNIQGLVLVMNQKRVKSQF
jgi:hypothetical protein